MKLTDRELGIIKVARALAIEAVEVGSMKSLNGTILATIEAGLDVRLVTMSEEDFNKEIENEQSV